MTILSQLQYTILIQYYLHSKLFQKVPAKVWKRSSVKDLEGSSVKNLQGQKLAEITKIASTTFPRIVDICLLFNV